MGSIKIETDRSLTASRWGDGPSRSEEPHAEASRHKMEPCNRCRTTEGRGKEPKPLTLDNESKTGGWVQEQNPHSAKEKSQSSQEGRSQIEGTAHTKPRNNKKKTRPASENREGIMKNKEILNILLADAVNSFNGISKEDSSGQSADESSKQDKEVGEKGGELKKKPDQTTQNPERTNNKPTHRREGGQEDGKDSHDRANQTNNPTPENPMESKKTTIATLPDRSLEESIEKWMGRVWEAAEEESSDKAKKQHQKERQDKKRRKAKIRSANKRLEEEAIRDKQEAAAAEERKREEEKSCEKCHIQGHKAKDCWARPQCVNCQMTGHEDTECWKKYSRVYPGDIRGILKKRTKAEKRGQVMKKAPKVKFDWLVQNYDIQEHQDSTPDSQSGNDNGGW